MILIVIVLHSDDPKGHNRIFTQSNTVCQLRLIIYMGNLYVQPNEGRYPPKGPTVQPGPIYQPAYWI